MNGDYPQELMNAWAHVLGSAWTKGHDDLLEKLRKYPRQTIEEIAKGCFYPDLQGYAATILTYVDSPGSIEGILGLPNLPADCENLSEEQLVAYANQMGLFGIMRLS